MHLKERICCYAVAAVFCSCVNYLFADFFVFLFFFFYLLKGLNARGANVIPMDNMVATFF